MIRFDNSFAALGGAFSVRQMPTASPDPQLVLRNDALARQMGIDPADLDVALLAGNRIPEGAAPVATAYAGHQFGGFVPQLGDGRAVLLGEVVGPDGQRRDIQLKGAGRTPFSRNGDGKAVIGPVLREYVVSEAMAALGIPTTRALAAVTTGEAVRREGLQPGAILTRVAASHLRVGSFQFHFARRDTGALQQLADYALARHYPAETEAPNPPLALLRGVMERQAVLVARWMQTGFIHGVMNTDNMAISGETIDYGPCAFMDDFHPDTVFSSIDRQGRYAWANQPQIAHWNLAQLGSALLVLIDPDAETARKMAQAVLDEFPATFSAAYHQRFCAKIGLADSKAARGLVERLLTLMTTSGADFTLTFRHLTALASGGDEAPLLALFRPDTTRPNTTGPDTTRPDTTAELQTWLDDWRTCGADAKRMASHNPVFIPRNHRIEEMIAAAEQGDYAPLHKLLAVLADPWSEQPDNRAFEQPPAPGERVLATFCGT